MERKVLDKFVHKIRLIGQMDRSHAIKIFLIKGLQQDRPRNISSRTKLLNNCPQIRLAEIAHELSEHLQSHTYPSFQSLLYSRYLLSHHG